MLEKILSRTDVEEFLHEVLNDQKFNLDNNGLSSNKKDEDIKNLYSLITMMDAIIKFSIIVDNEEFFEEYLLQLRRMLKRIHNVEDLEYGISKLICKIVSLVLNISDLEDTSNKKAILSYIYDRYIVNGYMFCGFDSSISDNFSINGIDPRNIDIPVERIRQINHFFNNRGFIDFAKFVEEDDAHVIITDSSALAYFYALASPRYLADICATSEYMNDGYDICAFYRKDYEACRNNIIKFSKFTRLSMNEASVVLQTATSLWNKLDVNNSKPCIAFIKRKDIGRNYLEDIRNIFTIAERDDIVISVSMILKSNINAEKRYTPIDNKSFDIKVMPSYKELYIVAEEVMFNEEKHVNLNEFYFDDLEEELNVNYLSNVVNNYGKSTILGLIGMLMITLGATLIILFTYYT